MYALVDEISRDTGADRLIYVAARFWPDQATHDAGEPPVCMQDFLMRLLTQSRSVARDSNGWPVDSTGTPVDPATLPGEPRQWSFVTTPLDPAPQLIQNLANYAARIRDEGITGNYQSARIVRDEYDDDGLLGKVRGLQGTALSL